MILRDRAVLGLLLSELVSTFGTRLTLVGLPWFVLATTGSAARMGFVLAAGVLPMALFGIPSGAIVARFGARRTLLASDLVRAPLIALVPALHDLGMLSFPLLLVLVFALGAAGAPYFASKRLILPEILGEDERIVAQANSAIEGANRSTALVGPVVAGFVISQFGAGSVLWLDGASFLLSFVLLAVLVPARPAAPLATDQPVGVVAALRFLVHDRLLGGMAATVVAFGAFWPIVFASLPVLAYAHHRDARLAGYLFALWGAGTTLGSALAFAVARNASPIRLARWSVLGVTLPLPALAVTARPWVVGAVLVVSGLFIPLLNAPVFSAFTLRTPPGLRAPVLTAVTTGEELAGPLVLAAAGPAIEAFGLRPAYVFVAVVGAVAAATFLAATAPTPSRAAVSAGSAPSPPGGRGRSPASRARPGRRRRAARRRCSPRG
jgi:MFS family permease